ncbi:hypothetical protein HNW77_11100 [Komagataeibacter sp. AV436]|uniref:Uracil-DNA glycosylase-like domain-containing protein n=1 Tax=Komagataeibacter melomenusus TaxID=2766578 RepID=A0ABX2AFD1_9PROT|nr:hypothetical protein [Komagataeibacter melomenusus]MBV1831397.1 hypothetical protein [Komagataeibacter melomenusus]NPC66931.1 hypothetical protein [Komagataeibacter melomenusus]
MTRHAPSVAELPASIRNHTFDGPGDIGSPSHRSLWLCGIEYGEAPVPAGHELPEGEYPVEVQWDRWTYNRNAFKLISVIEGQNIEIAYDYAKKQKIFESRTTGYFQTNLFPFECRTLETWSTDAQLRSGFKDKKDYIRAIREVCFTRMHEAVLQRRPRLFLGVGVTHVQDFMRVVFGREVELERKEFQVNGHGKVIYLRPGPIPFAVVSHLSAPSGLNSNEALRRAGQMIRDMMEAPASGQ